MVFKNLLNGWSVVFSGTHFFQRVQSCRCSKFRDLWKLNITGFENHGRIQNPTTMEIMGVRLFRKRYRKATNQKWIGIIIRSFRATLLLRFTIKLAKADAADPKSGFIHGFPIGPQKWGHHWLLITILKPCLATGCLKHWMVETCTNCQLQGSVLGKAVGARRN